nr:MAG TPA: hypothetical protein [Caudoviricetes sp.]
MLVYHSVLRIYMSTHCISPTSIRRSPSLIGHFGRISILVNQAIF